MCDRFSTTERAPAEWKPDYGRGRSSPVALIQLASSTLAVLIRVCSLPRAAGAQAVLPPCVQAFLR